MTINQEKMAIEGLRRRAKDAKSNNASNYSRLALKSLDKLRNILFLISFAALGYIGAAGSNVGIFNKNNLAYSIIFGLVSYILSYFYFVKESWYYSELENNLKNAFPDLDEYNSMLSEEQAIRNKYTSRRTLHLLSFLFIVIQAISLILSFNDFLK